MQAQRGACAPAAAQAICSVPIRQHKVYAQVARQVDIPILHIGDAMGMAIQRAGLRKIEQYTTHHLGAQDGGQQQTMSAGDAD
jgi:aspartate/glutamate racemase